jgi:hypothetical protein
MKRVLLNAAFYTALFICFQTTVAGQQTGTTVTAKEVKVAEDQKKSAEEIKKLEEEMRKADIVIRSGPERESRGNFSFASTGDGSVYYQGFNSRNQPRTSLEFSRSVTEDNSVKEYTFEVDKGMRNLSMNVSGMCKTGAIRITILMPNNKSYSEVTIDEFGTLNWRKSFEITDESKEMTGVWKFKVATTKATGNFRLSLQAS